MSTLTLLRHGQALFGASDYDALSETGIAQANAAGAFFSERGFVFDRIICGSLNRQRQTAQAVIAMLPGTASLEIVPDLDEFADPSQILSAAEKKFGVPVHSDSSIPREIRLRHYNVLIQEWANGSAELEGGPTSDEFRARMGRWLDAITAPAGPREGQPTGGGRSGRVLAVTSAGTIGACLAHLLGLPNSHIAEAAAVLGNCSITEIVYSSKRRSLLSFNTTTHLPASLVSGI